MPVLGSEKVRLVVPQLLTVVEAQTTMIDLLRVCGVPGWLPSDEAIRAAWDAWVASRRDLDVAIREHVPADPAAPEGSER